MAESHTVPLALRAEGLSWRLVGEEVLVIDERTWEYLSIGGSGSLLWMQLSEGPKHVDALADSLVGEYGIDVQTARDDVAEFVDGLLGKELLVQVVGGA
ncbi:MAG: PqqD family protein [Patulibacter sp.]